MEKNKDLCDSVLKGTLRPEYLSDRRDRGVALVGAGSTILVHPMLPQLSRLCVKTL